MATQRRHSRPRRTRGRFRGLYRMLSILLILAAVAAACVVFFRVRTVRVEGGVRYGDAEVVQASGVAQGDNLVLLNATRIQRQIRTQLPYILRVSVRRALPDTVVISILEESVAAAALQSQGQWWLVDSTGKLLEQAPGAQGHAVLTGVQLLAPEAGTPASVPEEEQTRWDCALALLSALEARGELARLDALECGEAGAFYAGYDGTYTILLPTTVEYEPVDEARFSYFLALLEQVLPQMEDGRDIIDFTLWETTGNVYTRRSK